jgi:hypothetical protein
LYNCSKTVCNTGFTAASPLDVAEKIGNISLGCSFVAGKSLMPNPAAGMMTLRIVNVVLTSSCLGIAEPDI